jgi:choline dehydrogenase-like flavoprotein
MRTATASPFGRVVSAREAGPSFRMACDVVVVGTGAGGAAAMYELARRGLSVVAIERGSWLRPHDMTQREEQMLPRIFAESGSRGTLDTNIVVLQGQGVGGSTLHNTNLCKRLPRAIVERWSSEFGVTLPGLDDDFDAVEALHGVRPIPDDRVNANNAVLERGLRRLGYRGGRLWHNRDEKCRASGFCELGCPNDGKLNAARVLVEPSLAAGACILSEARADEVITRGSKATGVRGVLIDPASHRPIGDFHVSARAVVLAGSAVGSAMLHERSKLPDPHSIAGNRLHLHPGAVVVGFHDEPIRGWEGVPQAVECTEFLDLSPGSRHRAWIVSGFAHPAFSAALMPGWGAAHGSLMQRYANVSCAISMLHDEASGRVRAGEGDRALISYRLDEAERTQMALGLRESARLLLAGGAREVLVPLRPSLTVRNDADLAAITADSIRAFSPSLTAVHPMSTLPMSADPKAGVTDSTGKHHHLDNVWVADGSLFPTSIGGPPQITIYALGRRVGRSIEV